VIAVTRRLDHDVDLLGVCGRDGLLFEQQQVGLAGRGEALRIELPTGAGRLARAAETVAGALAAVERDDEVGLPGCGPVAFAALPFGDDTPGSVVVPSVVVGRADDGTRWMTTVGPERSEAVVRPDAPQVATPQPAQVATPSRFTVEAARPPEQWCDAVAETVKRIVAGRLEKAVLARALDVEADAPIDVGAVLQRLRTAYPATMLYAIDGLVGATPELLVSRIGDVVRSHPFAGTTPRTGDPTADARAAATLLASTKDRAEHQITIDMVLDTMLPFCSYVDSEPEPSIVSLANVQHLATLVEGRLSSPPASALALVAALHPTPAVCGWPTEEARSLIAELERLDRGRYTGAVGWVDANGNGRFGVAIRCAEIVGNRARLFAGNGIVSDSDPRTELAETQAKLQAMLAAIVRV
jgi:menaquinone-specific isochorismate synthase